MLAVPGEDEDLFPEWEEWLRLERKGGDVGVGVGSADLMDLDGDKNEEDKGKGKTKEEVNGDGPDPDGEAVVEGSLVSAEA